MSNQFHFRIGRRKFSAGPIRVRDHHALRLAVQAIEEADKGRDPGELLAAYQATADALAGMCGAGAREAIGRLDAPALYRLAGDLVAALDPPADPQAIKKERGERRAHARLTREEMELPVWRAAMLSGRPFDSLMDMPLVDFNRTRKVIEAAVAELKLEFLPLITYPHITEEGRTRTHRSLRDVARMLEQEGGSEWEEHFARARRLMQ